MSIRGYNTALRGSTGVLHAFCNCTCPCPTLATIDIVASGIDLNDGFCKALGGGYSSRNTGLAAINTTWNVGFNFEGGVNECFFASNHAYTGAERDRYITSVCTVFDSAQVSDNLAAVVSFNKYSGLILGVGLTAQNVAVGFNEGVFGYDRVLHGGNYYWGDSIANGLGAATQAIGKNGSVVLNLNP